ncbi:hypothetical protein [Nocardioides cynanchi]|uniref:hypothetical protein n=1 Tax=Nocardioides cynanchi TaxID=2558918 RepID=UPI00124822AD|nr:hypothetical protein [Nocardioides cynanchi]
MLLRSIRAHLLTSCATLALALVVGAGAVGVTGAARVGHTPGAVAAMLALYGAVALAEQTARSTAARAHDVALARLRGMTGVRLVAFAASPLLAICLVGIGVGSAAGVLLAGRIADSWHTSYSLGTREVVVAVALLLGAWLTVVLVAAGSLRRPLTDAISVQPRRRGDPLLARFLEILVVAAAVLAVYEARTGSHSWVPVIAPALVALAAGQVVTWLVTLTPRAGRRLGLSLTSRRLRRDPDPGSVLRIMVAAAVLLAVTLTGSSAASSWRLDSAHLRAGGPTAVPFTAGGLRAYSASHDADPDGRWLMAEVAVDDLSPVSRRVFVDAQRWPAVVGDYFGGTSAAAVADHVPDLAGQADPVILRGAAVGARVSGLARGQGLVLKVEYTSDAGYPKSVRLTVTHDGSASGRLPDCRVGCSLLNVTARGDAARVEQVTVGTTTLLAGPTAYPGGRTATLVAAMTGVPAVQRALTTGGIRLRRTMPGLDGTSPEVTVLGTVGAIPLLGRYGSLLDLSRVLRGAVGTVAAGRAFVVARADTPGAVLATLHADGGGAPTSYDRALGVLSDTPQARGDTLALLVSLGVALVALTHLGAWLAGQLSRRRAEVAGLRVAGVGPRAVRGAYRVEASVLGLVVLVGSTLAAVATTQVLLRPMRLVGGWAEAPPVDLSLRPEVLVPSVAGVAAVVVLGCSVVFTRFGRAARPSALRSADR